MVPFSLFGDKCITVKLAFVSAAKACGSEVSEMTKHN